MQIFFQSNVSVAVQFRPWFKFYFVLSQTHYHIIIIHYNAKKQRKIKIEPNKNVTAVFRNMRTLLKSTVSRSTFFVAVNHNYGDS